MSIYHARLKRSPNAERQSEQPAEHSVVPVPAGALPIAPPVPSVPALRKARPIEYMLPASLKWFESLPPEVRPVALAAKYARIVNLIAQQWNDDSACRAYFDELLTGRRANREGFPVNVRRELWTLREYYQRSRLRAGSGLAAV